MADVDPIIISPPTADDVRAFGARRLEAIVSGYSRQERETWAEQTLEALSLAGDPSTPAPLLTALAEGRGISISDMAERVLSNRSALQAASGAVLKRQAEILAMTPIPTNFREIW